MTSSEIAEESPDCGEGIMQNGGDQLEFNQSAQDEEFSNSSSLINGDDDADRIKVQLSESVDLKAATEICGPIEKEATMIDQSVAQREQNDEIEAEKGEKAEEELELEIETDNENENANEAEEKQNFELSDGRNKVSN